MKGNKVLYVVLVIVMVLSFTLTACNPPAEVSASWQEVVTSDSAPEAPVKNGNVVRSAFLPTPTAVPTQAPTPVVVTPDPNTIKGQEDIWLAALEQGDNIVASTTGEVFIVMRKTADGIDYFWFYDSALVWTARGDRYVPDQSLLRSEFFDRFAYYNFGYDQASIFSLLSKPPLILNDAFSATMPAPAIPTAPPTPTQQP